MTIVNPNTEDITINYFNRYESSPLTVEFYNESTRITEVKNIEGKDIIGYYSIIIFSNSDYFKEGNSYVMSIKDVNKNILFLDKVYATSQNVEDYTINKGVYTTNPTNTDYIIYEWYTHFTAK